MEYKNNLPVILFFSCTISFYVGYLIGNESISKGADSILSGSQKIQSESTDFSEDTISKTNWVDASESSIVTQNSIVSILSAEVKHSLSERDRDSKYNTGCICLIVSVGIKNNSEFKKVDFTGYVFQNDLSSLRYEDYSIYATDDFGNKYESPKSSALYRTISGNLVSESIYPKKSVVDLIHYEKPVKGVSWVYLELPMKNIGEEGVMRFKIPAKMIKNL